MKITKRSVSGSVGRKLLNSELNYAWGLPGAGKSTLLAAVAQAAYENGIPCFSNYPIRHAYKWQGFDVQYPVGSIFLFDEIYDLVGSGTNRGILPADTAMFFKTFRHSRYTVWACSQEVDDVARRIRGIVTKAWLLRPYGGITRISPAEIKEVKDSEGDKYEIQGSVFSGFFTDWKLKRKDFYDDFDSYCRTSYKYHAEFTSW